MHLFILLLLFQRGGLMTISAWKICHLASLSNIASDAGCTGKTRVHIFTGRYWSSVKGYLKHAKPQL